MPRPLVARLRDIHDALQQIDTVLRDSSREGLAGDRIAGAALERFLEIVSEASRHLPDDLKAEHPHIPWRQLADIGNWLRHVYRRVDPDLLWSIHVRDLPPLKQAIRLMLERAEERDG